MTERHVWALRRDHAAAQAPLTLEQLAGLPHLVRVLSDDEDGGEDWPRSGRGLERAAVQDDDGALQRALAGIGRRRTVRLTIPDSYTALAVVGESDLAALVPARMAERLAGLLGLRVFKPPYASAPVAISMVRHPGNGAEPAAAWLRDIVLEEAAGLRG